MTFIHSNISTETELATIALIILTISMYNWNLVVKKRKKKKNLLLLCFREMVENSNEKNFKWSEILCQINQKILNTSKNNHNNDKAFSLMCLQLERIYKFVALCNVLLAFDIHFYEKIIQSRYAVVWNVRFHHQDHLDLILSNIWLMFICLKRFILIVNG